jgi:hypothetical protein
MQQDTIPVSCCLFYAARGDHKRHQPGGYFFKIVPNTLSLSIFLVQKNQS